MPTATPRRYRKPTAGTVLPCCHHLCAHLHDLILYEVRCHGVDIFPPISHSIGTSSSLTPLLPHASALPCCHQRQPVLRAPPALVCIRVSPTMPSSKRSASPAAPSAALSAAPSCHVPHCRQAVPANLKSSHPARELCLVHAHLYGLQIDAGDLQTQRPPPILLHHDDPAGSSLLRPPSGVATAS
jgi:hypothetical protein